MGGGRWGRGRFREEREVGWGGLGREGGDGVEDVLLGRCPGERVDCRLVRDGERLHVRRWLDLGLPSGVIADKASP